MQIRYLTIPLLGGLTLGRIDDSKLTCSTIQGTKPAKSVPTITRTHTNTCTIRQTKYNQKTVIITPNVVTQIAKTTATITIDTALNPQTETILATQTDSTTTTVTIDATTTFFASTTVIATSTNPNIITVPTASNFVAIQTGLVGLSDELQDSGALFKRRDNSDISPKPEGRKYHVPSFYPQKVECDLTKSVSKTVTITQTKPAMTLTASAMTRTVTDTITVTNIQSIVPDPVTVIGTTTITEIAGTTITASPTTATISTTVTTTVQTGPTVYAMCSYNNYWTGRWGGVHFNPIDALNPQFTYTTSIGTAQNAYGCCNLCGQDSECIGFAFDKALHSCIMYHGDGCSPTTPCTATPNINPDAVLSSDSGYTIGNGPGLRWISYTVHAPA